MAECKHCGDPTGAKCETCDIVVNDQCMTCHNELLHGQVRIQNIHIVGGPGGAGQDGLDKDPDAWARGGG